MNIVVYIVHVRQLIRTKNRQQSTSGCYKPCLFHLRLRLQWNASLLYAIWRSRTAYSILYIYIPNKYIILYSIYSHWKYLIGRIAASNSQPKSPLDRRLLGVSVECTSSQKYDSIVKCCCTRVKKNETFKNNMILILYK